MCLEDTIRWSDGTECLREDLEEYLTFMSDDYEVVPFQEPKSSWLQYAIDEDLLDRA